MKRSTNPGPPAIPAAVLRIEDPESALFASDMHLHESDPALVERFFDHLRASLERALARNEPPALFLLGDLFEYWIGDDHVPAIANAMALRLAAFARDGGSVFLMHGNRDFLIDAPIPYKTGLSTFSARCGATLLPDPAVIEVAGRRIALSHGDALCVDDTAYQQWRTLCRSAPWQKEFLSLPVAQRVAMAQALRKQSLQAQAATETIHDLDPDAVDSLMTRLGTSLLVHGHTHQPSLHRWHAGQAAGSAAAEGRARWVLSDWGVLPPRGSVSSLAAAAIPAAC